MTLARTPFWPLALLFTPLVHANDSVMLLTSWYAQAEHGGFYQAQATGLYQHAGLDVEIKMGGPQINVMQLMAAVRPIVPLATTVRRWRPGRPGCMR